MNQFAPKWYRKELSIRYVSGPRNQKILSLQQVLYTAQPSELTIAEPHLPDEEAPRIAS